MPDEQLHDLRIRAKRCRYAAEAAAAATGKNAAKFAREVAALQEVLGELHDAVVAEAWLRERSAAPRIHETALFAAGELVALQRDAAQQARDRLAGSLEARRARVVACLAMRRPATWFGTPRRGRASAGRRPDRDRPLTAAGKVQAVALAELLAPTTRRVLSSPYVRCVETVAPLAEAAGLRVEEEDRLAEGADPAWAMTDARIGPWLVLCTHGDVMASIVMSLADAHVPMDRRDAVGKGRDLGFQIAGGRIVGGRYLPPPV